MDIHINIIVFEKVVDKIHILFLLNSSASGFQPQSVFSLPEVDNILWSENVFLYIISCTIVSFTYITNKYKFQRINYNCVLPILCWDTRKACLFCSIRTNDVVLPEFQSKYYPYDVYIQQWFNNRLKTMFVPLCNLSRIHFFYE